MDSNQPMVNMMDPRQNMTLIFIAFENTAIYILGKTPRIPYSERTAVHGGGGGGESALCYGTPEYNGDEAENTVR